MIQVIFTPEAIQNMGIRHTTFAAITAIKQRKPKEERSLLIFVEGISNVQTHVPLEQLHVFTEGNPEVDIRYLDAEMN